MRSTLFLLDRSCGLPFPGLVDGCEPDRVVGSALSNAAVQSVRCSADFSGSGDALAKAGTAILRNRRS
jgi:hypothetical protein